MARMRTRVNGAKSGSQSSVRSRGPVPTHLGLDEKARAQGIRDLDGLLADLSALRALYKHFHWRVAGRRFIMLHKLYDEHVEQVGEHVDMVAERIQTLGGQATAWPGDVAKMTRVSAPSASSRQPEEQLRELIEAHAVVLKHAHAAAEKADEAGDLGTNDLLAGTIIRGGQLQVWFIGEHLDHVAGE